MTQYFLYTALLAGPQWDSVVGNMYNTHTSVLVICRHVRMICYIGVSNCDILRLSQFWNIIYHDCENNHDYRVLTIFDNKLMHQVTFN